MFGQASSSDPCADWTNQVVAFIAKHPEITTVVVVYRINLYLKRATSDAHRDRLFSSYLGILRYLHDAGKRVVLILPPPEMKKDIRDQIPNLKNLDRLISESASQWAEKVSPLKTGLNSLPSDIIVIDPARLFCDQVTCYASDGDVALYADDNHPSVEGSRRIAEELFRALQP
jgi:hypothetical protein